MEENEEADEDPDAEARAEEEATAAAEEEEEDTENCTKNSNRAFRIRSIFSSLRSIAFLRFDSCKVERMEEGGGREGSSGTMGKGIRRGNA